MGKPVKKVAVVGSGITGLSASYLLAKSGWHVTLIEKEDQCGGHTLTDSTGPYPVDLGFQVFNFTTYPNLCGLLETLGVDSEESDMSFSLSIDGGRLEWGSDGLSGLFAQKSNMMSPTFLAMVVDVLRFGRQAPEVLDPARRLEFQGMTLGDYLGARGYSDSFVSHYVAPMCAAVWSVPTSQVMRFPVQTLVRFWVNHHLLDIFDRPVWRIVKGRSKAYVDRILQDIPEVRTSASVVAVRRPKKQGGQIELDVLTAPGAPPPSPGSSPVKAAPPATPRGAAPQTPRGTPTKPRKETLRFDAVVMATHSDVSLAILGQEATEQERAILGAIPYSENDVWLHTDASLMPKSKAAWTCWNFLGETGKGSEDRAVCVTYWLNRLQNLPQGAPNMFVTLNPLHPPRPDSVIRRLSLAHPVFSQESVAAQEMLPAIQGNAGVYYCGAWAGYGFHEDGLNSALDVVKRLGASIPWTPRATSPKRSAWQGQMFGLFDRFCKSSIKTGRLRLLLPNGEEAVYGPGALPSPSSPSSSSSSSSSSSALSARPELVHLQYKGWEARPPAEATVRVYNWDMFQKIISRHDTGLGEAYMDGDLEVDNPAALMTVLTANAGNIESGRGAMGVLNWVGDRLLHLAHLRRANTIEGSRRNIEEHYDAGNDMYQLFLDETMLYSAAVHRPGEALKDSQLRKVDLLIRKAGLKAGDRVLEVGCGWGAFAIRAAQTTGCHVTGLTISKEQLAIAAERVRAAGLEGKVSLLLCDYRDYCGGLRGEDRYDKIVSIEMIEAVGHENLPTYFSALTKALKPGGRAVIQAISVPDARYDAYRWSSDFIREHVFPGGHLVCLGGLQEAMRGTGMTIHDTEDIGLDYAITLRHWRKAWEERRGEVLALGYSDRFWRKFRFYFAYCEAAFDARYIHNFQVVLVKEGAESGAEQDRAFRLFQQQSLSLEAIAAAGRRPAASGGLSSWLPSRGQVLAGAGVFAAGAAVGYAARDGGLSAERIRALAMGAAATAATAVAAMPLPAALRR